MTKYIGDIARRVVHELDHMQTQCLDSDLDLRMVRDLHSAELIHYLVQSEHWTECEHCLGHEGGHADPFGSSTPQGHPLGAGQD